MNKSKVGGLKWNLMKLKPLEDQNSETKTKTEATNLKLNRSNPYEKKIKTDQTNQTDMRPKPNQTHQIHMKPKPKQNH